MRKYTLQLLIAIDQLVNAILCGYADETLSSRAWRTERNSKPLGMFFRPIIDALALLFGDINHCKKSFDGERAALQLPPELRKEKD